MTMEYGIHGKRRMFDNKLYRAWKFFLSKADAKQEAATRRRSGVLARVVRYGNGYDLYIRG